MRPLCAAALALLLGALARADEGAPGGTLAVEEADGSPAAGALVGVLETTPEGRDVFDASRAPIARGDAAGRIAPWPPPAAAGARPVVYAEGRAALPVGEGEAAGAVRLARAMPLSGRIRFDRGLPAKDLEVLALPEGGEGSGQRTRTGSDGAYRFAHLPAGRWVVSVRRPTGRLQGLGAFAAGSDAGTTRVVRGTELTGRLADAGVPGPRGFLAGVTLRLRPLPAGPPSAEGAPEATTGQGGTWAFPALPPGVYEAEVGPPWVFADGPPRVEVGASVATDLVVPWFATRMRSARTRVVDLEGAPVRGAVATLLTDPTRPPPRGLASPATPPISGPDGLLEVGPLPPASDYRLVLRAPGRAPQVTPPFHVTAAADVLLPPVRLGEGWRLEVLARDSLGNAVAGAKVSAAPVGHPAALDDPAWAAFGRRATTDADGRAMLEDLPLEDVRVAAEAEGFLEASEVLESPRGSGERTWKPALFRLPELRGRVETEAGGAPPPVRIVARPRDGTERRETRPAADGAFRFEHLRPVVTDLEAYAADGSGEGPPTLLSRVEAVVPGESGEVVVPLPALRSVEGRVGGLEPDGPAAALVLEAPRWDAELERHRWTTVRTVRLAPGDVEAAFRVEGLPPGPYGLRAVQGARDSEALTLRLDREDVSGLRLGIPTGSRIAGTVLDAGDRPVLGARVRCVRLRGDGDEPDLPGGPLVRATDDAGGYVFEDVAPGLWRVEAADRDLTPDQETVRVAEGEWLLVRDLLLGRGGALEGRVEDALGRPMDGASVTVRSWANPAETRRLATDADGRFRSSTLRPGTWLVRLEGWTGGVSRVEALADVTDGGVATVVLAADGRGRIEGTVRRRGKPAAGVVVELLHDPDDPAAPPRRFWVETDVRGEFAWVGLPPGRYVVGLLDAAARTESTIDLWDGDREVLDLEVFEGRLVGRVVTRAGDPVGGAEVRASLAGEGGGTATAKALTAPDGRFAMAGVPVAAYDLAIEAPGYPPAVLRGAPADVAGAEREVEVVLGRGATVDLAVLDDGRRGVRGARVTLEDASGTALTSRPSSTGPGGMLRIEGIPQGEVRLRVHARGFGRPPPVVLDLPDGEVAPVAITLRPGGSILLRVVGRGRDPVPRVRVDVERAGPRPGEREVVESRRPLTRVTSAGDRMPVPRTGVLLVEDLEEGTYELVVSAGPSYATARIPVRVRARDTTEVQVVLDPR